MFLPLTRFVWHNRVALMWGLVIVMVAAALSSAYGDQSASRTCRSDAHGVCISAHGEPVSAPPQR